MAGSLESIDQFTQIVFDLIGAWNGLAAERRDLSCRRHVHSYKLDSLQQLFGLVAALAVQGKGGLEPIHVGALPPQFAILNAQNAACEELAVEAALEGDPVKVYHVCLYDPLTSSMLSMAEIKEMVNKMFETQKHWLPYFKAYKV